MKERLFPFLYTLFVLAGITTVAPVVCHAERVLPSTTPISPTRPVRGEISVQRVRPTMVDAVGFCCKNHQVRKSTQKKCEVQRGEFYTDEAEAKKECRVQKGYCCRLGKVEKSDQVTCQRQRGQFFPTREAAQKKCDATKGFCVVKGAMKSQALGNCERTKGLFFLEKRQAETALAKTMGYCCKDGAVKKSNHRTCTGQRGQFSVSQAEAANVCDKQQGYCCQGGKVVPTNRKVCKSKQGTFSMNRATLSRSCRAVPVNKGLAGYTAGSLQKQPAATKLQPGQKKLTAAGAAAVGVSRATREGNGNTGQVISAMSFMPTEVVTTIYDDHFEIEGGMLSEISNELKLKTLDVKVSCGKDPSGNDALLSASIVIGPNFNRIDNLKSRLDSQGQLKLNNVIVASPQQFLASYPRSDNNNLTVVMHLPIVLTRTCAYPQGVVSHRLRKTLEVEYYLGENQSDEEVAKNSGAQTKTAGARLSAAGLVEPPGKKVTSSKELAGLQLQTTQKQLAGVQLSVEERIEEQADEIFPEGAFELHGVGSLQEQNYWYVGNVGSMDDEFVYAPNGVNPFPVDGVTMQLQGTVTCGMGDVEAFKIVNPVMGDDIQIDPNSIGASGSFSLNHVLLLGKEKMIASANCYPGDVYFNKTREIKLIGRYWCPAPGGTSVMNEKEVRIPYQFSCDRRPLENQPMRRTLRYKHECPDGYHIKGTTEQFVLSEQAHNDPAVCVENDS